MKNKYVNLCEDKRVQKMCPENEVCYFWHDYSQYIKTLNMKELDNDKIKVRYSPDTFRELSVKELSKYIWLPTLSQLKNIASNLLKCGNNWYVVCEDFFIWLEYSDMFFETEEEAYITWIIELLNRESKKVKKCFHQKMK